MNISTIKDYNFRGIFNWKNGDPVSFQPWKYLNLQENKLLQKYYLSFPNQCAKEKSHLGRFTPFLKFCPLVKKVINNHALNKYKYSDETYIQSQLKKRCTLMLLTNLAEPELVSINCSDRIIGDIMCMVPRNINMTTNISLVSDLIVYKNPCIFITGKCYLIYWGFPKDRSMLKLKMSKSTLNAMEFLLTATNVEFPPFHSFLNLFIYCKISRE